MKWILILFGIVLAIALAVAAFDSKAHHNTRFLCKLGSAIAALLVVWGIFSALRP